MPLNLSIKLASVADIENVASMFDLYRQFYEQIPNIELATKFIAARIERGDSTIFLAEDASGLGIGFCQLYPTFCSVEAAPIYVLYDLFVRPEVRRSGAGRALLMAAEAHAKENGVARMDLTTAKNNRSAQALYESLGWKRDDVFLTYNRHISD
jgi:ribosomal protein S18 acetylase RimI-like enzyme